MKRHWRTNLRLSDILHYRPQDMVQIFRRVFVDSFVNVKDQLMVIVLIAAIESVFFWYLLINIYSENDCCFIGPATWHIFDRISTSTKDDRGNTKFQHIVNTLCVPFNGKIQMTQSVFGNWICPTLHYTSIRSIRSHDSIHHFFEEFKVCHIVDSFFKRDVNWEELSYSFSHWVQSSRAWEKVFIKLMKWYSHNSICVVKGLLNSVSVVNIDI